MKSWRCWPICKRPPAGRSSAPLARASGSSAAKDGNFEQYWQKALHNGVIPDTAFKPKAVETPRRLVEAFAGHWPSP